MTFLSSFFQLLVFLLFAYFGSGSVWALSSDWQQIQFTSCEQEITLEAPHAEGVTELLTDEAQTSFIEQGLVAAGYNEEEAQLILGNAELLTGVLEFGVGGALSIRHIGNGKRINVTRIAPNRGADWPQLSGALKDASNAAADALKGKGKINFGMGSFNREQTMAMGEAWVGPGYRITSKGFYESADGLRQFRPPLYKQDLGKTQANFEQRLPNTTKWGANGHVDVIE
jgi:hypothetical protein